mgnify:CR=1 FL=1
MKEKKKIGSDVLWVGHNEEPSIRNLFKRNYCKDHPLDIVKVINDCHMYQCGMRDHTGKLLYPFVLCDLDGLVEINGVTGILECKTCNKGSEDYKLWKKPYRAFEILPAGMLVHALHEPPIWLYCR